MGAFKENVSIEFSDGNSLWLGLGLNLAKPDPSRVCMEFNPNKVCCHQTCLDVLRFLNVHSKRHHTSIRRFDLAIDIPAERQDVRLAKDGRVYSERRHGKEWTEYLGAQSSHVGRVKLYNKQVEAGLPAPLTRLEITLDPLTEFERQPGLMSTIILQIVKLAFLN